MIKRLAFYLVIIYFFCAANSVSQNIDSSVIAQFNRIIQLIKSDNVIELSKCINYPIRRQNPLPDILNLAEFIREYPILFDSAFKERLKSYSDSDVFEHNGAYGLGGGEFAG